MDSRTEILLLIMTAVLASALLALALRVQRLSRRMKRRRLVVAPADHVRLQKQLFEHIARLDLERAGGVPRRPIQFRSEWGEDALLYDLFCGQRTGTFVEVGALDGLRCSVSYAFEAIGWSGVLIEAGPELHAACVRNRPDATVVHAALGGPGSSGTTTFMVPVLAEHQPSGYRPHDGMGTEHIAVLEKAGAGLKPVTVPLATMDDVLKQAGVRSVDWAVIDVEGAELDVLRGFDLARFGVRALVVEDNSLGRDTRIADYLEQAGYAHALWIGANRVLIADGERDLLARARRLAETVYSPFVRPSGVQDTDARLELGP